MHNEECKVLTPGADEIAKTIDYNNLYDKLYEALKFMNPLKCILLQLADKNKLNHLIELQSYMEHKVQTLL